MRNLQDYLLRNGIKGKIFRGVVGGRIRDYFPVDFDVFVEGGEIHETSLFVTLVGPNIPKKIKRQREEKRRDVAAFPEDGQASYYNSDYKLRLSKHLGDTYVGVLNTLKKRGL